MHSHASSVLSDMSRGVCGNRPSLQQHSSVLKYQFTTLRTCQNILRGGRRTFTALVVVSRCAVHLPLMPFLHVNPQVKYRGIDWRVRLKASSPCEGVSLDVFFKDDW